MEHQGAHRAAARALRQLRITSLREEPELGDPDLEGGRKMWRKRYAGFVGGLPTSGTAIRTGLYRETNVLSPAEVRKRMVLQGQSRS
ncbi:hypothetical protein A6A29_39220 [Streptomyces sp. TSRI0281]|nr:hypothetical protein A6A29_39220 [Streptomyces sp. TSRI0281]